ncbi:hypothetical protein MIB92_18500 [Aestuariirhabdus sp. Z084]|uniref:hypothetical protein n=1 Tax=Aestuariirhabdus haliotis TaxID=2918751 RepID=UPI00201B4586|nr:hypothetical protein [Aestuariirhabdus haliotis]MCL6417656.1 hypothetical protein [Aestuariirhabdus haliotis]MCL6421582.1 hypothetical protein [Aestuariirhabdus haliotis]
MTEQDKGIEEVRVFEQFVRAAGLPIDIDTIRKCYPPKPDIRCRYHGGDWVYFELTELCDENLAKREGLHHTTTSSPDRLWLTDPAERIVRKKLQKRYPVSVPIELLCYKRGRLAASDTDMVTLIRPLVAQQPGPFVRVWFFGERLAQMLWSVNNAQASSATHQDTPP